VPQPISVNCRVWCVEATKATAASAEPEIRGRDPQSKTITPSDDGLQREEMPARVSFIGR